MSLNKETKPNLFISFNDKTVVFQVIHLTVFYQKNSIFVIVIFSGGLGGILYSFIFITLTDNIDIHRTQLITE